MHFYYYVLYKKENVRNLEEEMVTLGNKRKETDEHKGKCYFSQKRRPFTRLFQKYFLELCAIHRRAGLRCQLGVWFPD